MQAYEFEIDADKNIIEIPSQYQELYSKHMKVIILVAEDKKKHKYDFNDVAGKLEWQGDVIKEQRKIRDEW
ncbi:hypothetical protein [Methyloprofundus sp.]|uniref:hypothetical protein n=1 Tax=Methyloprofundus sp. TaxID=2020875 RepID=UPI003D1354CF